METTSSQQTKRQYFHAVVPTVASFPLPIVIFSFIILTINTFGFFNFFTILSGFIPGIGSNPGVDTIAIMISGRQLGVALVLVFALLYKHIRVMQLAWIIAIIREIADLALARGSAGMTAFVIVILIAEIATIVYLQKIASGQITKYVPTRK